MKTRYHLLLAAALTTTIALPSSAAFEAADRDGRIEIRDDGKLVFAWRHQALRDPKGGELFASSAFIHPLTPPSGFELTQIQPDDHLHHFGVWWPWKMVTVDGKEYVTWELQNKQGRHRAVSAEATKVEPDVVLIGARNRTEISKDGKTYQPVIDERVAMRFARMSEDAYALDIDIFQQPVKGRQVAITNYRYSGFSWRGTAEWNKGNSTMRGSGGHHRDNANHQPAKWLSVSGRTPDGMATLLMLSAAPVDDGKAELLRVWGSDTENGAPFANFNPVVKQPVPLTEENESVARRSYRLIVADRDIPPAEADKLWQQWTRKP